MPFSPAVVHSCYAGYEQARNCHFHSAREELKVDKREVETEIGVRITKSVSEREEIIDEPLTKDEVVVERVVA
jgi:stress response protein YsnF